MASEWTFVDRTIPDIVLSSTLKFLTIQKNNLHQGRNKSSVVQQRQAIHVLKQK